MIIYYFRTVKDDALKQIDSLRNGVWIHAEAPTETELTNLVESLDLDQSMLEDAKDFFEVPRLERSNGITYFFTRYPYNEQTEDTDTAPLLIVVGETFVLTITQRDVPQLQVLFEGKEIVHTTQKTKLFIRIMQAITVSYEKQLVRLRKAVQKDRVHLRKIGNQEIVRFVNYEHKLNDIIAAVLPTNFALQQVLAGSYMQIYKDDRELVEDLRVDNTQVVESARSLLKTIQNVRSATEAILTNSLNNRIKTLTVLTILLTIPTIVSSLYGMNVPLPLQDEPLAFAFVLMVVVFVMAIGAWYFKKRDWF